MSLNQLYLTICLKKLVFVINFVYGTMLVRYTWVRKTAGREKSGEIIFLSYKIER